MKSKSDLTSLTQVSNSTPLTGLHGVGIKAKRDISVGDAAMDKNGSYVWRRRKTRGFLHQKQGNGPENGPKKETSKSREFQDVTFSRLEPKTSCTSHRRTIEKGKQKDSVEKGLTKVTKTSIASTISAPLLYLKLLHAF